jgi:hypothetical protein
MISSPLARVTEESAPTPLSITTISETVKQPIANGVDSKLVSVDTPRHSGELPLMNGAGSNKENELVKSAETPMELKKSSKVDSGIGDMGDMKTVEI